MTKLKILLIISFWISGIYQIKAQQKKLQDVAYLKNGSIIRGKIISQADGKLIIETKDKNRFVYDSTNVETIKKEAQPFFIQKKGYLNYFEAGVLSGSNESLDFYSEPRVYSSFTFRTFQGYQFHPAFALGLTTGIDWYHNQTILPIAIGLRGDFLQKRITPFYGIDLGQGTGWLNSKANEREYKGGFLFDLNVGVKVRTLNKTSYLIGLGFNHQITKTISTNPWIGGTTTFESTFNRLALKFAVGF